MQPTGSKNTTGEAQVGLDLTGPLRQWQVNRHFTRLYPHLHLLCATGRANSAVLLEGERLLCSVFVPQIPKTKAGHEDGGFIVAQKHQ